MKKVSVLVVSQHKGLGELLPPLPTRGTLLACLIVLDNLQEVFGCSIVTYFMSIMFTFSIVFGCWIITFDSLTIFLSLIFKNDL